MAAMVSANLPTNTAFGNEIRLPFQDYLARAGLGQNWVMFHTIPYFRAIRPVLVAMGRDGNTQTHGPMLPGLGPYTPLTRLSVLFIRYAHPSEQVEPHLRAYLRRACDEVTRATGIRPYSTALRLDALRIPALEQVRNTQRTGVPSAEQGPVTATCQ
jgi:hypothetical protein